MLRNEMKKNLKALKSTQIIIKLVRIKIELNTNELHSFFQFTF